MTDQLRFYVKIDDGNGNILGSGPLTSVSRWRYTTRLDRAGTIAFDFSANDPQAAHVTATRVAKAYALLGDTWTEVGAGLIDQKRIAPGPDGRVQVQVSGRDLIGELATRTVGNLEVGAGTGTTLLAGLNAIWTEVGGMGWTFSTSGVPNNDYFYQRYAGESVLGAVILLAQRSDTHFYRSFNKTLILTSDWTDSGVRAIQAPSDADMSSSQCAIVGISQTIDSYDLLTRIHPYGGGTGDTRLTLAATTRTAPPGYTLSKANNYIQHDSAYAAYGIHDHPEIEFKDVTPIANTTPDIRAASNMLFDAALLELKRRASIVEQHTYTLRVAGCQQLLRPMQMLRVVYRDVEQGIDIDEDLYILEATWEVGPDGLGTTDLVVSTLDRWPENDATVVAERMAQGRVFQAHPQMGPNSYVHSYTKNVDHANDASFRFRLGSEIVQMQQALFEFQLLNFESTVRSVGGTTTSSGSSSESTSDAGSAHSHTVTIAAHTHEVPDHQHNITIIGNGGALTNFVGFGAGGTSGGLRHDISASDYTFPTNSGSGGVTSESGGSSTPTSSSESTHTHGMDHDHRFTPEIVTEYGIFRDSNANTLDISQLEYRVNGGTWNDLETDSTDAGDGWYQLDVTDLLIDADTFRPNQTNNLIEIQAAGTTESLSQVYVISNDNTGVHVPTTTSAQVGSFITISGTTNFNGTYEVTSVVDWGSYYALWLLPGQDNLLLSAEYSGTVTLQQQATIDAQLSIRNIIQGIAYE